MASSLSYHNNNNIRPFYHYFVRRPCAPGRGCAGGQNFLAPHCYSQRAVFASPLSTYFTLRLILKTKTPRFYQEVIALKLTEAGPICQVHFLPPSMPCLVVEMIQVQQHKKLAPEKIRVEEGCVDLDPLSWPQAAESDGTGESETTGTTCNCSVDSFVARLRRTS